MRRLVVAVLNGTGSVVSAFAGALVHALRGRPFEVALNILLMNGAGVLLKGMTGGPMPAAIGVVLTLPGLRARAG